MISQRFGKSKRMWLGRFVYRKRYYITTLMFCTYIVCTFTLLHYVNIMTRDVSTEDERKVTPSSDSSVNELVIVLKRGSEYPELVFANETGENGAVIILINNTKIKSAGLEKIDWNDYDFMANESKREGPGEQGQPVILSLAPHEMILQEELHKNFKYNAFISDRISLERSIGDLRTEGCKRHQFIKNIPENSVSVIIVFHNEKNSTLLRTVHGIVNRSPAKLIREIILIDDKSSLEEVKAPLDEYISKHFSKVRVIRNFEREGLIKSRMVGADASSGSFLVFFDAHIEVNNNYLPPLLEPIVLEYKTITCPITDEIHPLDLHVFRLEQRVRSAFNWQLVYKRIPVSAKDETTPHASPVMLGCAFAISKRWWEEIGKYDPGFEVWGAEQYELPFKTWQCGGSLVDAPCSRVAHLFRPLPYIADLEQDNTIEKNFQRLISVWMDEYKENVLQWRPIMRKVSPGNITQQLELRRRLKCKPFKWFMEVIAPDILHYFPVTEPPPVAWGTIRLSFNTSQCLVVKNSQLHLDSCVGQLNKEFSLTWRNTIQILYFSCLGSEDKNVDIGNCVEFDPRPIQQFAWNRQNGHIVSLYTNMCMEVDINTHQIYGNNCNETSKTQSWQFSSFNATEADRKWALYTSRRTLHKPNEGRFGWT